MDDALRLLFDFVIIVSGIVAHCWIAYTKAGKLAVSAVKRWLLSEDAQIQVINYLTDAIDKRDKSGTSLADRMSLKILTKILDWTETPQAIAVKDRIVSDIMDKIKKWAGGKITGMGNQAKSGIAGAELDLGAMIKQMIMQKVLAAPAVQQFLGGAAPPPPPA